MYRLCRFPARQGRMFPSASRRQRHWKKASSTASGPTAWVAKSRCAVASASWCWMFAVVTGLLRRGPILSPLVATESRIANEPDSARAAIRAVMKAHKALKENVSRATQVGKKRFPPSEAELIAELIRRDLPYYDPTITEETVTHMNRFAQDIGLLSASVPYDQVVAAQFTGLWREPV